MIKHNVLLPSLFLLMLLFCRSQACAQNASAASVWQDRSPHKSGFVQANGVRLHYLNWGGRGRALLFLADMGYCAHIFDDIAPQFTDRFHVLGLTRRGHGQSEKPSGGYDTDTLIEDIRQFLDRRGIERVTLVGHGLAGVEMKHFASQFPNRVEKLVYLDAAYDSEDTRAVLARYEETLQTLPPPAYPTRDAPTFDALRTWGRQRLGCWSEAMEAELRADIVRHPDGRVEDAMPAFVEESLRRNTSVSSSDYARVKAPALSFYSLDSIGSVFPWLPRNLSPAQRKAAQEFVDFGNRQKREQIARFRKGADRRVIEMPDTVHHGFITRQAEVVQAMRAFLTAN